MCVCVCVCVYVCLGRHRGSIHTYGDNNRYYINIILLLRYYVNIILLLRYVNILMCVCVCVCVCLGRHRDSIHTYGANNIEKQRQVIHTGLVYFSLVRG